MSPAFFLVHPTATHGHHKLIELPSVPQDCKASAPLSPTEHLYIGHVAHAAAYTSSATQCDIGDKRELVTVANALFSQDGV